MAREQEVAGSMLAKLIEQINLALQKMAEKEAMRRAASTDYLFNKAFEEAFKNGTPTVFYKFKDMRLFEETLKELEHDGIPFRKHLINGEPCLQIIQDEVGIKGYTEALEASKIILGNYYQEAGIMEMADIYDHSSLIAEEDKQFIRLDGLDDTYQMMLKNKSNDITKGFMVGTEITNDGKMALAVNANKVLNMEMYKNGDYKHDFCRAMLAATLSYSGENKERNIKQLEADQNFNEQLLNYGGEPELYVTGEHFDRDKAIHVTKDYVEFMKLTPAFDSEENKTYTWQVQERVYRDEPGYKKELQKFSDRIFDECTCGSLDKLTRHALDNYREGEKRLRSVRPKKTKRERLVSNIESKLTNQIDTAIKMSFEKTDFDTKRAYHASEEDIIKEYRTRTQEVFKGILENNCPKWMVQEQFEEISNTVKENSINVERYYEGASKLITDITVRELNAAQLRSSSTEYVNQQKEKEIQERSKARRQERGRTRNRNRERDL